jgi:8-oxo-dGTP diphosphatase
VRGRQRLAAYALIVNGAGRVLLTRQPDSRRHVGRWLLPGGGIEHSEHPEQAVIREVLEETGMTVRVGALCDVLSDVTTVGRRRRAVHNVRLIYRAAVVATEPGRPGRRHCDNARWCSRPEWEMLPLAPFAALVLATGPG